MIRQIVLAWLTILASASIGWFALTAWAIRDWKRRKCSTMETRGAIKGIRQVYLFILFSPVSWVIASIRGVSRLITWYADSLNDIKTAHWKDNRP